MPVTIYTKNGCPYCSAAKERLANQGLKFIEINLSQYPDKIAELVSLSGHRKVPVIVDNGKVTVGLNGGG